MSNFYESVYQIVKKIPSGRVTSYGAIANALGAKKSSRMVGYAMKSSHIVIDNIPAHRVVNRVGMLTGRHNFNPPELMEELLKDEGVMVENNKIIDFEKHFWDPIMEL